MAKATVTRSRSGTGSAEQAISSAERKRRLLEVKNFWKKSLFAFAKSCIGFDKMHDIHLDWATELEKIWENFASGDRSKPDRFLYLMPKGTYKTSLFTIAYTIWLLLQDPNLRILIVNNEGSNAEKFLKDIKDVFMMNRNFRTAFGDYRGAKWQTREIIISKRTARLKESTIQVVGKQKELTSAHFDVIIVDDLVARQDRDSETARKASIEYISYLESMIEERGIILYLGTHWHYQDAYGHIRKTLDPEMKQAGKPGYKIHIEDIEADPARYAKIYPDMKDLKMKVGLIPFYALYKNNPLPPETQLFREENIHTFEFDPVEQAGRMTFLYWDPASTEARAGRDPDFHAIFIGSQSEGTIDLLDVALFKAKPSAGYERALKLIRDWKVMKAGVETNHLPDAKERLTAMLKDQGIYTGVSGWKNTIAKTARIDAIEPIFTSGRIRFRHDWKTFSKEYADAVWQILAYPVADHDDAPDALAGLIKIAGAALIKGSMVEEDEGNTNEGEYSNFRMII